MVLVLSMGSESKSCINPVCYYNSNNSNGSCNSNSNDIGWKKGWALRSGAGFADLCNHCGSAYEKSIYCNLFHFQQPGWRECEKCNKPIHCGCIASATLFDLLDAGGIICLSCKRVPTPQLLPSNSIEKGGNDGEKSLQLCSFSDTWESDVLSQLRKKAPFGELNSETMHANGEASLHLAKWANPSSSSKSSELSTSRLPLKLNDGSKLLPPSLNISLGAPAGGSNLLLPFSSCMREGSEKSVVTSSFQQGARSRPILSKLQNPGAPCAEASKTVVPQARIARPPAEGRGKNQLLPRYWPKITDQELQKISGDLNSNVVPLFEKILSASDAGRIGRLVLPKACAEAYFPPISQSEGVPVKIQDMKGNEWTFQFRFWPNNNSRMYVLEGVTPCIQSMQLQAGDTVTFSQIDPGGKLVMGFRKARCADPQENQASNFPSESLLMEASFSSNEKNVLPVDGYTQFLPSVSESRESHLSSIENVRVSDGKVCSYKTGNQGTSDDLSQLPVPLSERKKTRNIGSKNRRLLMHNDDVMELRLTWEEAQDLLRPPPSVKPSVVTIEGHDFEEYDEPPVFGKRTIYSCQPSGEQEQWAQCDNCSKWRRLYLDVLLPPRWTCSDNVWDSERRSCSVPEETIPQELGESPYGLNRDTKKKRRVIENHREAPEHETSGLDALASAAMLGDCIVNTGESSVGATTKHPRHRPGCTCIVCIQPPSGKGKHKPTCTCNVCMTVKRRFKTLMLRKKKRQSEHEVGTVQGDQHPCNDESGTNETSADTPTQAKFVENGDSQSGILAEGAEISNGCIDLNSHPNRDDLSADAQRPDVTSILQAVHFPLEKYLPGSGLGNPHCGQTTSTTSCSLPQSNVEETNQPDEEYNASEVQENDAAHSVV